MSHNTPTLIKFVQLPPKKSAEMLREMPDVTEGWLEDLVEELDAPRIEKSLRRTLLAWGLNQSEAARLFGVSRQALHKWLEYGVPAERSESVADLAAATDLLLHYLKRDRVPAVVRRPIPLMSKKSLLDLLGQGRTKAVLSTCREMFDFQAAQH